MYSSICTAAAGPFSLGCIPAHQHYTEVLHRSVLCWCAWKSSYHDWAILVNENISLMIVLHYTFWLCSWTKVSKDIVSYGFPCRKRVRFQCIWDSTRFDQINYHLLFYSLILRAITSVVSCCPNLLVSVISDVFWG